MTEQKKKPIVVGISLIIAAPLSAFCGAAVFALLLGAPFTIVFYAIAGAEVVIGALAIIGGIKEFIDRRKAAVEPNH